MSGEELALRCDERALDLAAELELLEVELAALNAQHDARWQAYEADSKAERIRWALFYGRSSDCRRNAKQTAEDIEHYLACDRALRAPAASS
jgi:hypothetical protein